ncbi:putative serine/threonine-protein kinase pbl8 [Quercus suber]|uniref:Serine/threonine-protein kinase pbl8 n=1 Tax=Quercus suber TaxID=58331 RepID=A0AAW0LBJ0_QUESU
MEQSPGHILIQFTLSDLKKATKSFKSSYKIGEGDFGAFYRGTIKLSGKRTPVLIQQIQGHVLKAKSDHSWVKELNTIAAMKHQNLLNLVGYCLSEGVRFVVGECICIGSLSYFLSELSLSWVKRLIILQSAAQALEYFMNISFGVILLEIVTNKPVFDANRPKNERNLVEWVKTALSGDQYKLEQIIDPMSALWVKDLLWEFWHCQASALRKTQISPSMSKILKELAQLNPWFNPIYHRIKKHKI